MPTYKISDVLVDFPYVPYDCQLKYMKCLIDALNQGENALLESPTGTGKTVSLLCATLAWREYQKNKANKTVDLTSSSSSSLSSISVINHKANQQKRYSYS